MIRGHSLSMLGRTEEALADLTDALAKYRATGAVTVVPLVRTWFAEALGKAGRPTEGLEQLDEAERQIESDSGALDRSRHVSGSRRVADHRW